jgi:hypothetical protein
LAAGRHISYGHAWNGIPFLQEWNGHSIWNGIVHSRNGMAVVHSGRNGMDHWSVNKDEEKKKNKRWNP